MNTDDMNLEQLEDHYGMLTRNMSIEQVAAIENDPIARPGDSDFIAARKAAYWRLAELKHGIIIPNDGGLMHIPV